MVKRRWRPELHPRDDEGQFTDKGTGWLGKISGMLPSPAPIRDKSLFPGKSQLDSDLEKAFGPAPNPNLGRSEAAIIADHIKASPLRADETLKPLTIKEMRAVAKELKVPLAGGVRKKADVRDEIVKSVGGDRSVMPGGGLAQHAGGFAEHVDRMAQIASQRSDVTASRLGWEHIGATVRFTVPDRFGRTEKDKTYEGMLLDLHSVDSDTLSMRLADTKGAVWTPKNTAIQVVSSRPDTPEHRRYAEALEAYNKANNEVTAAKYASTSPTQSSREVTARGKAGEAADKLRAAEKALLAKLGGDSGRDTNVDTQRATGYDGGVNPPTTRKAPKMDFSDFSDQVLDNSIRFDQEKGGSDRLEAMIAERDRRQAPKAAPVKLTPARRRLLQAAHDDGDGSVRDGVARIPNSSSQMRAIDAMEAEGLIRIHTNGGAFHDFYSLTAKGREALTAPKTPTTKASTKVGTTKTPAVKSVGLTADDVVAGTASEHPANAMFKNFHPSTRHQMLVANKHAGLLSIEHTGSGDYGKLEIGNTTIELGGGTPAELITKAKLAIAANKNAIKVRSALSGFPKSRSTTTSVKGWHNISSGWSVRAGGSAVVVEHVGSRHGTSGTREGMDIELQRYAADLEKKGFSVERNRDAGGLIQNLLVTAPTTQNQRINENVKSGSLNKSLGIDKDTVAKRTGRGQEPARPGKKKPLVGMPEGYEVRDTGKTDYKGDPQFDVYGPDGTVIGTVERFETSTPVTNGRVNVAIGFAKRKGWRFSAGGSMRSSDQVEGVSAPKAIQNYLDSQRRTRDFDAINPPAPHIQVQRAVDGDGDLSKISDDHLNAAEAFYGGPGGSSPYSSAIRAEKRRRVGSQALEQIQAPPTTDNDPRTTEQLEKKAASLERAIEAASNSRRGTGNMLQSPREVQLRGELRDVESLLFARGSAEGTSKYDSMTVDELKAELRTKSGRLSVAQIDAIGAALRAKRQPKTKSFAEQLAALRAFDDESNRKFFEDFDSSASRSRGTQSADMRDAAAKQLEAEHPGLNRDELDMLEQVNGLRTYEVKVISRANITRAGWNAMTAEQQQSFLRMLREIELEDDYYGSNAAELARKLEGFGGKA